MKCANCKAVLSGEPSCPTCGTVYTVSRGTEPIPGIVDELETRLAAALEGRYELRGLLGHGGMGAVFLAAELSLDRLVAIKVLPPSLSMDEELLGRFQREARTAARLDHRGIVPIHSVETTDGLHFYVMKFVPGTDLSDEIEPGGMPMERARRLLWESAVALGHAHRRGVIHRDVKPANIMIDPAGRAVLTDFGIAKAMRADAGGTAMTSTGQMIGTPQYMSPEQMEGREVDGRADQYSLGMVAWHMLAGRQPFQHGSVAALLIKQLNEYPESLAVLRPELPDAMVGAIERAIRKDPDERFEDMESFARALWPEQATAVEGGGSPSTSTTRPAAASGKAPAGRRSIAVAAVVVLALSGAIGASVLMSGDSVGTEPSAEASQPAAAAPDDPTGGDDPALTDPGDRGGVGVQTGAGQDGGSAAASVGADDAATESPSQPPADADAAAANTGGGAAAAASSTGVTPPSPVASGPGEVALGYLSITARPYATVDIDGIELSQTPIYRHELPPGAHVVVLRRAGYATVVDTVLISAGNVTTRTVQLIPNGL